ncbi:MAG: ABC transporter substrate-binding protein [Proteobacteria bacterium]|nr:ABC transporter substrate-binding protein [Pseudomonadota bacterium]
MTRRSWQAFACMAALAAAPSAAWAEASEIRFVRQFSMGYLQFNVMEREGTVEKHAKALGLGDIKVTWQIINGPNAVNDALISGSVDVVAGGVPGLVTLWSKTKNTAIKVKGISAFTSQPFFLNTRSANVKTIADFTAADKIAVPSIKTSVQAVVLQMAAAKQWGAANYAKLDNLTVPMSPPDATVAIMSGAADITSVFSVPPYQAQQLEREGIHTVLKSYDVFGGPHTFTVGWTTTRFHDENPKLYQALILAMREATDRVNQDIKSASQYWIDANKSKIPLEKVMKIAGDPPVRWTMVPEQSKKFADFMQSVGTIKEAPASWKDMFFPEVHDLPGS